MKLTALQIGLIASHCERVIKDFPENDPPDHEYDPEKPLAWEQALISLINEDPALPHYTDSSVDKWVDEFMNYLAP